MLSIFAFPKPFRGHIGMIQYNAISSWVKLHAESEIFLFGDEEGTAQAATEFRVHHVAQIARNEFGTPLLSEVFKKGRDLARHSIHCYVNCDIILGGRFVPAVERVSRWRKDFLMVGECWNLDVNDRIAMEQPEWEASFKSLVQQKGKPRGPDAIDYFVFPRELYQDLPPFALGRPKFDNWLIWKAQNLGAAVVDASDVITAIHQNHDYFHVGSKELRYQGDEARRNLELAGGVRHIYTISEASHRLLQDGIKRNWRGYIAPQTKVKIGAVMELTRPLRHTFGLHLDNARRIKALFSR